MEAQVLLGGEGLALAAVHAGITAAYSYPGTPATEILEYLIEHSRRHGAPVAQWAVNEKTAYETALGVCLVGRRALVSMKHVGLNVAADPFINSALVGIHGGLVVAVADDPGMHSSQNEQDSRYYADFARVPCLEPATQQEIYDMVREAYDLSERFAVPVLLRLTTRLAHSRSRLELRPPRQPNPIRKAEHPQDWILIPLNARRRWRSLLDRQPEMARWGEESPWNTLELNPERRDLGVITCGLARSYYLECVAELGEPPSHLHIGAYPPPLEKIRALAAHSRTVLVLEEGYPLIERQLRGVVPGKVVIQGKMSGEVRLDGELDPDVVRAALGLPARETAAIPGLTLPGRPPQLCSGCPHIHSMRALEKAMTFAEESLITSDIGCYALAALPPYEIVETCVCMGAAVGLAKGAADAGFRPVVGIVGDSTFLHSGITPLVDAVASNTPMTLIILDNQTVAMTGGQDTLLPSSRLKDVVLGLGVAPERCHVLDAYPRKVAANAEVLRQEVQHEGLSVVIMVRECAETARRKSRAAAAPVS